MDNPAQSSDLTDLGWEGDLVVAQKWLDKVWRSLCLEVPSLEAGILSGGITTQDAADVVISSALRVLRNPEGFKAESTRIDDYQESFERADATQDIYFTAAELRRLVPSWAAPGWFAGSIGFCR